MLSTLGRVVFKADLARSVANAVYNKPVVVEIISLGGCGEITAGGQVKNLAFLVADKVVVIGGRRACGRTRAAGRTARRTGTRATAYRASAGQRQGRAVCREDNGAVFIGAIYRDSCRRKSAKGCAGGVTVGVAAYADNSVFGACCTKERSRTGAGAAVMGYLKNVTFQVLARAYDFVLDGGANIAGEKETEVSVLNHYYK